MDYPYINYGVASRQQTNGEEWQQTARLASLERFEPQTLGYFSDHLVDVYEEAATIARPPLDPTCRRPLSNKTGYIICVYKVFDGDDGEKFERNWLYWTGWLIVPATATATAAANGEIWPAGRQTFLYDKQGRL